MYLAQVKKAVTMAQMKAVTMAQMKAPRMSQMLRFPQMDKLLTLMTYR